MKKFIYTSSVFAIGPTNGLIADEKQVKSILYTTDLIFLAFTNTYGKKKLLCVKIFVTSKVLQTYTRFTNSWEIFQ
jgi:hypothetical protein